MYDYATLRRQLLFRCRSYWAGHVGNKRCLQRDLANLRLARNMGITS